MKVSKNFYVYMAPQMLQIFSLSDLLIMTFPIIIKIIGQNINKPCQSSRNYIQ